MSESTDLSNNLFQNAAKYQVNEEKFSDVTFLVGKEKVKIYGHKIILAFGSPVFESMFYGGEWNGNQPIEIPDLTPIGFLNMIKCIYGFKFKKVPLTELYETCVSCNKYLAHGLANSLLKYSEKNLDKSNCCLIYDLLIEFGEEASLDFVRNFIRQNTRVAFESDYFIKINIETLIDMLKLESLNVDEVTVMEACLKWVESEVSRLGLDLNRENKNKIFEPLKSYIKFTELTDEELSMFDKIEDFLSNDEIGSLFLHLLNKKKPFSIPCKTTRINEEEEKSISLTHRDGSFDSPSYKSLYYKFSVNRKVRIQTIWTTIKSPDNKGIEFFIWESDTKLTEVTPKYMVEQKDGKLNFKFERLDLKKNLTYKIQIKYPNHVALGERLSNSKSFILGANYKIEKIIFKFYSDNYLDYNYLDYSYFERIDCIPLDEKEL